MAAEPQKENHRNMFIEVADIGDKLSSSLIKFASRWSTQQASVTNIATNVLLTTSLLRDLGDKVYNQGDEILLDDDVFKPVCFAITFYFEKLLFALELGEIVGNVVQDGPRTADNIIYLEAGQVGSNMLKEQLGGLKKSNMVRSKSEGVKEHVWYLLEVVRFLALSRALRSVESDKSKRLKSGLQQINVLLQAWEKRKAKTLRKDAEESNINVTGPHRSSPQVNREIGDDARSIRSMDLRATDDFLDIYEIYESWVVIRLPWDNDGAKHAWSFLGLKIYQYTNEFGYSVKPEWRIQEELKAEIESVCTESHIEDVDRFIASLPAHAQLEIDYLLVDRDRATWNSRFIRRWQVVDIKPRPSKRTDNWMTWWKGNTETCTQWQVVIKGRTATTEDRTLPVRNIDPFRMDPRIRGVDNTPLFDGEHPRQGNHILTGDRERPSQVERANTVGKYILTEEEAEQTLKVVLAEISVSATETLMNI